MTIFAVGIIAVTGGLAVPAVVIGSAAAGALYGIADATCGVNRKAGAAIRRGLRG